jgi:hypothetical protein
VCEWARQLLHHCAMLEECSKDQTHIATKCASRAGIDDRMVPKISLIWVVLINGSGDDRSPLREVHGKSGCMSALTRRVTEPSGLS